MQYNFDSETFEKAFKPWLHRKLLQHAEHVIDDMSTDFRRLLREGVELEVSKVMATLSPSTQVNITLTFGDREEEDY